MMLHIEQQQRQQHCLLFEILLFTLFALHNSHSSFTFLLWGGEPILFL